MPLLSLSQLLQYNKQNRTVLRCSLAQAEPRSQYIQLVYIIYCCATQIKQKFLYLHYFAAGQSDSRNPCRSLTLFLVPQSCRFWKLDVT